MSKKVFYRYNPATDNYERVYPSWKNHVWVVVRHFVVSLLIGAAFVYAVYQWVDFPREKVLRNEIEQLNAELDVLNERLNRSLAVMKDVTERDNNFYRVMMQAERIPMAQRYAGLENENLYSHLNPLSDAELIKTVSLKMDMLDRLLYTQIKSFDELRELAGKQKDRLAHVPAIQPVSELELKQMASGYGYRTDPVYGTVKFHEGMDFAADIGTPVYATGNAKVVDAGWDSGYGNAIVLDHGYNYTTRYAHLSKIHVKPGQTVKRGDLIGEVGNTGKSTGPHLHYEVHVKGRVVNPVNYYFMDLNADDYDKMIQMAGNHGKVYD